MRAAHRHSAGHEHEFEPQRGLPEALPADEHVLWQGSPDWRVMARHAFHVRKLVLYFGAVLLLRAVFMLTEGATAGASLRAVLMLLPLAALAIGLLTLMAWLSARSALYTVTDKRVVMRIGIVLTLTFNIPFKRIAAAGLHRHADASGDIPMTLVGDDRIALLHLWPHARPWRMARPEPMLRCVPNAAEVARILAEAWRQETGRAGSATAIGAATSAPGSQNAVSAQPVLSGR